MEWWSIVGVLLAVLVGSYVQAVAGFAMAMIIVAVVGGFRLLDVPTLAAVISLLTIINVSLALKGQTKHVHRKLFAWLALGQVPAIYLGLLLMQWMDGNTRSMLEICLGLFVFIGGLSMLLKPHPWRKVSGPLGAWLTGVSGGLVGGMFSASGPVLGWFGYSQPLPLAAIRATLLSCFALTTFSRIHGGSGRRAYPPGAYLCDVRFAGSGAGTWLGRNFAPPVNEETIKKCAYFLLLVMGVWILGGVAIRAW